MDPVAVTALAGADPWKQRAFIIHRICPPGTQLALAANLGNDCKHMPFYHTNPLPFYISQYIFKQAKYALTGTVSALKTG